MNPAAATVRALIGRTEHLSAFDVAARALVDDPDDVQLQHLAVLALARAGATGVAQERLAASRLVDRVEDLDPALAEDVLALEARIAKDGALAAPIDERRERAADAARRYEAVYERHGRTYTGINAATMWCVAGEHGRARRLAAEVLRLLPERGDYWSAATRAEALLLSGDVERAAEALRSAAAIGGDVADRASTRRQLTLLCDLLRADVGLVDALAVPAVVHYCGHLPARDVDGAGRLQGDDERRVADEIDALLARRGAVIAHGSLAAGADIVVAEAVLRSGGELHVVLPFPAEEFVATSVAPAGRGWPERFRSCLDRAAAVTVVTGGRQGDDGAAFSYCSAIAMGSAVVRAHVMASSAEQVAAWDGVEGAESTRTADDIARWRATGLPATVIPVEPADRRAPAAAPARSSRVVRALLFADLHGFSELLDQHIPTFVSGVLARLAAVLDDAEVEYRNGWGDAIYVVHEDVGAVADVALRLQETIAAIDFGALGLPYLALRVGVHAGPVHGLVDPVRHEPSYFGEHVIRAALVEPVAPPGAVFATDAFAALLALDAPDRFVCEYVGRLPAAKGAGTAPMYLVRRRPALVLGGITGREQRDPTGRG